MQNECLNCGHQFFSPGQNDNAVTPAAQCPNCQQYRTQPSPVKSDMAQRDMPDSGSGDDMGGNPLQEGILADGGWKNRTVRDESFASVRKSHEFLSLFDTLDPEFETTGIMAPPDLYRHGMETEAANRAHVQLPKGITDNLHATLGNLQAWVENPHENGALRPYYDKYWKSIRPQFMKPGGIQIGVADPTMAEIINHVAQTDDMTPLYEYRGRSPHTGGIFSPIMDTLKALTPFDQEIPGLDLASDAADVAGAVDTGANAASDAANATSSSGGIGGMMNKVMPGLKKGMPLGAGMSIGKQGIGMLDDAFGMGQQPGGGGGGGQPVQPTGYYTHVTASDEDDMFPGVHGEVPKNEDGDHKQQADGNNHEWQRDITSDGGGRGSQHSPSFDHGGPAMQKFEEMFPKLLEMMTTGQDGTDDPELQALHQLLEAEIPGYMDHADDGAMHKLIMVMSPNGAIANKPTPEKNPPTHADENSGGMHHSKAAQLTDGGSDAGDFLPDLRVTPPSLLGARTSDTTWTPEQIAAVQQYIIDHPDEVGLKGSDIMAAVLSVPTDRERWANILAKIQQASPPPAAPEQGGMSAQPPPPAQESAPPGATMPMPGMQQQMMSAVERYSADAVAMRCPHCRSHTTELIDAQGQSHCHACGKFFKTKGKTFKNLESSWTVDALVHDMPSAHDDPAPVEGVPIADQHHQEDSRDEQDSGHTWTDDNGDDLVVGQEYKMFSGNFDIPDVVRIEAVKPTVLHYTITGEFGIEHSTELSREEANLEGTRFEPTDQAGELGTDNDSLEENNDDNTAYTGPEHTDLSAPAGQFSSSVHQALTFPEEWTRDSRVVGSGIAEQRNPKLAWLDPRTAGANYTALEQRALIDEKGEARNADMLDLTGTHYLADPDEDNFLFGY